VNTRGISRNLAKPPPQANHEILGGFTAKNCIITEAMDAPLFLRACRREPVERTPLWLMRQAGRYLPEYREVRAKVSFLELCRTPELAAEVTLQPIRRFPFDAAIIFSDILVPVEAMGVPLTFDPGPKLGKTVDTPGDIEALRVPDPATELAFVGQAIQHFKREAPNTPILGFAGAPFTLASYLVEGVTSKGFHATKSLLYQHPKAARDLTGKLAETVARHLEAQIDAGADAVQIFDSWAGVLSRDDYLEFGLTPTLQVIERLKGKGVPIILFAKGAHASLEELAQSGADVVGVDWTLPLDRVGPRVGRNVTVQGNLDPAVLFAPPERIEREVQRVLTEAKDLAGHVFNLGHGILPNTPPEHVQTLVEAVARMSRRPS
jgi:uroporphyrinogen decarboxylase